MKVKPQFVTFFGYNSRSSGKKMVGIGLTDESIAELKEKGVYLQTSERNNQDIDVVILYEPTLNELVRKINTLTGQKPDEVNFI